MTWKRTISLSDKVLSLIEFDRPADRIRQHRQVYGGPILVTESHNDELVLKPHVGDVSFFPVGGKK